MIFLTQDFCQNYVTLSKAANEKNRRILSEEKNKST
jgi:hypothetical protein